MDNKAIDIVTNYVKNHLDKSVFAVAGLIPDTVGFDVYIVWKCKTLQNWKWLISTSLPDGMYYELTYNGDKKEFYLDVYKKCENVVIKNT